MECGKERHIEFLGAQSAEKVLFKFLNVIDTDNLKKAAGLLNAKHNPTAGAIRESTDGLPNILGQVRLRGLDLEIVPFYVA